MIKLKLSITILVLILAITYSFYYIFQIGVTKDVEKLVEYKITQNALFVKEVINSNKIKNESQLNEWRLSNKIAEKIDDLNDSYIEKSLLEKKIKNFVEETDKTKVSTSKEDLKKELIIVNKDIRTSKKELKERFVSLTRTLKMNFHFLISEHLSRMTELKALFKTSNEFLEAVKKGKTDSDIWMRKNFLYNVYGVPITLNGKVLGTLFIGSKKSKKDADLFTEKIKSKVAYVNNNRVLSTNLYGNDIKSELNKYISKHKEELKTLSFNDISENFKVEVNKKKYMAKFIPLKSYNDKVSGIIVIHSLSNDFISVTTKIKYWLPIFSVAIFFLVLIMIVLINRNFVKPYVDLEIQANKFLHEEDIHIKPSEYGEAEGIALSIKRLIKKIKGEVEVATWDDPLFVTELQKDKFITKKKEKDHYDYVYNMFIKAHLNNGLAFDHIKQDEFKKRLLSIENRLKAKFKVKEIYFEVLIDESGVIKLHPQIVKEDGVS